MPRLIWYAILSITSISIVFFESCSSETGLQENPSSESQKYYLAINLVDAFAETRGEDDIPEFIGGDKNESFISECYFIFLNKDGSAHPIRTKYNFVKLSYLDSEKYGDQNTGDPNVQSVFRSLVMLESEKDGNPLPYSVIALANPRNPWNEIDKNNDLNTLKVGTATWQNTGALADETMMTGGFFMTNSVYSVDGSAVIEVPCSDHIALTKEMAEKNPVTIPIERINARFDLNSVKNDTGKDNTWWYLDDNYYRNVNDIRKWYRFQINEDSSDEPPVYANVIAYGIMPVPYKNYILKNIRPLEWSDENLGFKWNDPERTRSYWAQPYYNASDKTQINYDNNSLTSLSGAALSSGVPQVYHEVLATRYRIENTRQDPNERSNVVVACQLTDANDQPHPYYRFMGKDYYVFEKSTSTKKNDYESSKDASERAVRNAICGALKGKYWVEIEGGYRELSETDIQLISAGYQGDNLTFKNNHPWLKDRKDYETVAELKNITVFSENVATNEMIKLNPDDVNRDLAKYPAQIATHGYVYYYAPIKHLGNMLGAVRNHRYDIVIKSIVGYGTPVFDVKKKFIPTIVENDESHLDLDINVQAWRVVNHKYTFDNKD